jgi:hypothetical protein
MHTERRDDDPNLEQRRSPRVDLLREIECECEGVLAHSGAADLSVGGMFVDLQRASFPAGSRVTVRFALHPGEPRLVVDADVHYVQEGIGVGLRFTDLQREDRERIERFVEEEARHKGRGSAPVRKSARVVVQVPIRVRGVRPSGPVFEESTSIITLSKHGACLVSACDVDVGMRLQLETPSGREFKGNVVWVGSDASRSGGQVGIQCRGLAQSLGFQFP